MSETPIVGKTYPMRHERFGRATVKVVSIDGEWLDLEILKGTLRGMGRGAVWRPSNIHCFRLSHCYFYPPVAK